MRGYSTHAPAWRGGHPCSSAFPAVAVTTLLQGAAGQSGPVSGDESVVVPSPCDTMPGTGHGLAGDSKVSPPRESFSVDLYTAHLCVTALHATAQQQLLPNATALASACLKAARGSTILPEQPL